MPEVANWPEAWFDSRLDPLLEATRAEVFSFQ